MESKKSLITSVAASVVFSLASVAAQAELQIHPSTIQVSRYTSMDVSDVNTRRNIMVSVIDETFGHDIKTVGDAVTTLANKFGYRIGLSASVDDSQYYLFNLPLPSNQREFSPFPLISTFALLGGEGFDVVVHPARREISYQLKEQYQGSFTNSEMANAKAQWMQQHPNNPLSIGLVKENCERSAIKHYGPVKDGESLIAIMRSLKLDNISDAQAMMSIFDLNPSAFLYRNINYLIQGVSLNIPSVEVMREIPKDYARNRVNEHNTIWKNLKSQ